jgi:hypothetical protein
LAERYCRNCGHELREDDRFCPSCGRPVHETAHVPTPEAAVPVPPPSSRQAGASGRGRFGDGRSLLIAGLGVLLVLALLGVGLVALVGGGAGGFLAGEPEEGAEEARQQPVAGAEPGPADEASGYILLHEQGGYAELLFLQFVREGAEMPGGGRAIRGYLTNTTAFYEPGLPVAQATVNTVDGTIDDTSLQFTEEQFLGGTSAPAPTYYYGNIEGSRMELTRDLPGARTTWVGEEGTLEVYHEEVEELVRKAQEEAQNLPSQ